MRAAFTHALVDLAEQDRRVMLLTGDLGYTVLEPFAEKFPDRFINVGVAEQNMVGLATGLAEAGFLPFVYSIVTFAALRPYEFIRHGPLLHHLPVRIIGVGGGFEYGSNGASHYGLEDIAVMRVQPAMTVVIPADFAQARTALRATWQMPGPVYYRLGRDDQRTIPGLMGNFALGRLQVVAEGRDLLIIAMGAIACEAVAAADLLAASGISCTVAVLSSVSPPPTDDLAALLAQFRLVVTVEAHYVSGGAGSLVAEVLAERGLPCRLVRCGVRTTPTGITGSQTYMERTHELSAEQLAATARQSFSQIVDR